MIQKLKNLLSVTPKPRKIIIESAVTRHIKALPNKLVWPDDTPMTAQTIVIHCSEPINYRKFIEGVVVTANQLSNSNDFQIRFSKMDGQIEIQ